MRVAVLGAGLQGACVAMELASRGTNVDLFEKKAQCLTQASARNEGKIHLGFVYANDRTLQTARTMLKGALAFSPLLRRWIGNEIDQIPISEPFYYAVHRDSLLSREEVERHLHATHAIAVEQDSNAVGEYFGADYRVAPERLSESECESLFDRRAVLAAYRTPEIGIDAEVLAAIVSRRLSSDSHIHCRLQTNVQRVEPDSHGISLEFESATGRSRERYDHVVNTLWDGRLLIDQTAGLQPERPWLFRVKYHLRIRLAASAPVFPTTTIVLGPFGDVVTYSNHEMYLSWYPVGMRGSSKKLTPPDWPLELDGKDANEMRTAIIAGLRSVVPSLSLLTPEHVEACEVKAGIIFAWGETDIDDRASGLHARYAIGPRTVGRYHSIDTGKLTMAPLFGKTVADRIQQIG
jgi:glycine/D-amino acid oxidase-like deaminating enzyme